MAFQRGFGSTSSGSYASDPQIVVSPRPGVEDVEVCVSDGRAEGLVGEVCGPPGERGEAPLELAGRGRVAPPAGVPFERALCSALRGVSRQG